MAPNKVQDILKNCTVAMIPEYIGRYPIWVAQYTPLIIKRIKEDCPNAVPIHRYFDSIIHALLLSDEGITETRTAMAELYVDGVCKKYLNQSQDTNVFDPSYGRDTFLFTILMSREMILDENNVFRYTETHAKQIYETIMDIYVPVTNSKELVDRLSSAFTLENMIKNANNDQWFIDQFRACKLDTVMSYKEPYLIFKHISDIYTNELSKMNYLIGYRNLVQGSYRFKEYVSAICDRYQSYFGSTTVGMVHDTLELLDRETTENFDSIAMDMIRDWYNNCRNVTISVLTCFLRDVGALKEFSMNSNVSNFSMRLDRLLEIVNQSWNDSLHVEEPYVFESDYEIPDFYNCDDAMEAMFHGGNAMNKAEKAIYKAYRTYKGAEEKVDSQVNKAARQVKTNIRNDIIEGNEMSPLKILKRALRTVALFSMGPIKGLIANVVVFALSKKVKDSERNKILMELDTEIEIIDEKINDARGDQNREAKYAMMRTRAELITARNKIKYGMGSSFNSANTAKKILNK